MTAVVYPKIAGILSSSSTGAGEIISVCTWANRPSASGRAGSRIKVTDFGAGGFSYWESDGTNWRPVGGTVVLPGTVTAATIGARSPAYTLGTHHTFTIPAGMIIPGCRFEGSAKWETAANTENKYMRMYINGTTYLTNLNNTTGTAVSAQTKHIIDFLTDESQVGQSSAITEPGVAAVAPFSATEDTTAQTTLTIVSSIQSTTDSITMRTCYGELQYRV